MNLKKTIAAALAAVTVLSSSLLISCEQSVSDGGSDGASATQGSQQNNVSAEKESWEETAKIIILAGQSNMAGASNKSYLRKSEELSQEEVRQLMIEGFPNVKIMFSAGSADAPSTEWHTSKSKFEEVVAGQGAPINNTQFGPELGLADYLDEKYPGEKFYIVKHALGGSFINEYLSNPKPGRCDSYAELTKLMDVAVPAVEEDSGLKAQVVAFCWMQGESDAIDLSNAKAYYEKTGRLVDKVRTDYGEYAPANGIAFIDATVNSTGLWAYHETVNNAKKQYQSTNAALNYLIYTNEAGLTCANEPEENPDTAHYDSMSQLKLGRMFGEYVADAMEKAYEKE